MNVHATRPFQPTGGLELRDSEAAARMGEARREDVRQNVLVTRQLREYPSILVHLTA
jgi:hypothetical protein